MDWSLLNELSSMFYVPRHEPAAADAAEPTETDLWIAQQAYEFMAARSLCDRCGARFGRRIRLAGVPAAVGHISVAARCAGWRRHQHTALVSRGRDGLRLGTLKPS